MSAVRKNKQVLLVVGPTGVGKSSLSIDLALAINGEIISADSRYLYRGMNIGTAKPSLEERRGVEHHLIDVANPNEIWSLADYLEKTYHSIELIHAKNKLPIIVGGTGQYMRALIEGWVVPELEANGNLRNALMDWSNEIGPQALHQKLTIIDAEAAKFIDPTNLRRTIRALEVIMSTGQKFSSLRIKEGPAYDYWIIGLTLDRSTLFAKVDQRIEEMFNQGLVEEVKGLLDVGMTSTLPSMSAIGYREVAGYLRGELDLETTKELMRKGTRQFIRRQANWFKASNPSIHWYDMNENPLELILRDLRGFSLEHDIVD